MVFQGQRYALDERGSVRYPRNYLAVGEFSKRCTDLILSVNNVSVGFKDLLFVTVPTGCPG